MLILGGDDDNTCSNELKCSNKITNCAYCYQFTPPSDNTNV